MDFFMNKYTIIYGFIKKHLVAVLAVLLIIQLAVPVYMIAGKYDVLINGEEHKFRVRPIDPYDAFRGRYVAVGIQTDLRGNEKYGIIGVMPDGFSDLVSLTDSKPVTGAYVKSIARDWFRMPIDRYYMDEKLAPKAESLVSRGSEKEAYVTARIKNGSLVISGLYVDGVPIEEMLRSK